MKTLARLIVALALSSIVVGSAQAPQAQAPQTVYSNVHKAAFQIGQETVSDDASCSATAIGPHALLTASHCEMPTDDLYIRGVSDPVTIQKKLRDGVDHTILIVNYTFKDTVTVDQSDPLYQGEDIFYFGNPENFNDFLRKGYIVGYYTENGIFSNSPTHIILDTNTFFGDSGAGIFNSQGKLILVINEVTQKKITQDGEEIDFKVASGYELKFTADQLAEAAEK